MNKQLNQIYFKNEHKFFLDNDEIAFGKTSNIDNYNIVLSMNKNFNSLGFSLDLKTIYELSKYDKKTLSNIYAQLFDIAKKEIGYDEFSSVELFYPNFPEEVMNKSDAELAINAMLYYTVGQSEDPVLRQIASDFRKVITEEKTDRLPLPEEEKEPYNIISLSNEEDFWQLISNKMHSNVLTVEDFRDLLRVCRTDTPGFISSLKLNEQYHSKENKALIAYMLHLTGNGVYIHSLLSDSKDVARFANILSVANKDDIHLSPDDVNASVYIDAAALNNINFKLSKTEKRLIKDMLNDCPRLFEDMWRDASTTKMFKKLATRVEWRKGPKRVVKAFDNLYNKRKLTEDDKPIISGGKAINEIKQSISDLELTKAANFIKIYPGLFNKHFCELYKEFYNDSTKRAFLVDSVCAILKDIPVPDVVTTINKLKQLEHTSEIDYRIDRIKNGKVHVRENTDDNNYDVRDDVEEIYAMLKFEAMDKVKLGNVYIDKSFYGLRPKQRQQRSASGGSVIAPGSILAGNKNKNLLSTAIYWKNEGNQRGDIDLAMSFYNEDYDNIGHCYYRNLKTSYCCHSGDYTDAPNGATEMIVVDKALLKENGIRYAVAEVHGFNVPFNQVHNLKFIIEERDGGFGTYQDLAFLERDSKNTGDITFLGEQYEPTLVKNPISLTSNTTYSEVFMYDVEKDEILWLEYGKSLALGRNSASEDRMAAGAAYLYSMQNSALPYMIDILAPYLVHANIVDEPDKADIIFTFDDIETKDNQKIINAKNLDFFDATFCNTLSKMEPIDLTIQKEEKEIQEKVKTQSKDASRKDPDLER